MKQLFFALCGCILAFPAIADPIERDCVVMLHGLARSDSSFALMEKAFKDQGYQVVRPDYPSTKSKVSELADATVPKAVAQCANGRVHFVTHSMGGILLREWLSRNHLEKLGRTVMLAPPNRGSEIIDRFSGLYVFDQYNGPAAAQLGTGDNSLPNRLPAVTYPVGVIAGNRSLNALFSMILPGEDDGKVTVHSTAVEGMQDHITLPVNHTFLMNNPKVITEALHFIQTGAFDPEISWAGALMERLRCFDKKCMNGINDAEY